MGKATVYGSEDGQTWIISIHAFRGEGDATEWHEYPDTTIFQSTPSVGKATDGDIMTVEDVLHFNPRLPWGRRLGGNNNGKNY